MLKTWVLELLPLAFPSTSAMLWGIKFLYMATVAAIMDLAFRVGYYRCMLTWLSPILVLDMAAVQTLQKECGLSILVLMDFR